MDFTTIMSNMEFVKIMKCESVEVDEMMAAIRYGSAKSSLEQVIRVMVEVQSDELCTKYMDEMVQVIREEGLAVE